MTDGDETPRRNAQSDSATTSIDSTLPQNNKNVKQKEPAAKNLTQLKDVVDGKQIQDSIEDLAKDVNDVKPDTDRNFIKNAFERGNVKAEVKTFYKQKKKQSSLSDAKSPNLNAQSDAKSVSLVNDILPEEEKKVNKKLTLPKKQKVLKDYLATKNINPKDFIELLSIGEFLDSYGKDFQKPFYVTKRFFEKSLKTENDVKKMG